MKEKRVVKYNFHKLADQRTTASANDSLLWERFKQGIETSFDHIYRQYFPELLNYGLKFRNDKDFTKDCIQELFAELWIKRKNLGSTKSIRFYLFLSLKRKILRKLKHQKQMIDIEDLEQNYSFDSDFTIEDTIVDKEMNTDRKNKLHHALNNLTSRQKEIIYLRFYKQLEIAEVAALMSITNQSARNLLFESLKKLRSVLSALLLICLIDLCSRQSIP